MITTELGPADETHALCEPYSSPPSAPWHIRKLTYAGRREGGGADTPAQRGRTVAWDMHVPITKHHLSHACKQCVTLYTPTAEIPKQ